MNNNNEVKFSINKIGLSRARNEAKKLNKMLRRKKIKKDPIMRLQAAVKIAATLKTMVEEAFAEVAQRDKDAKIIAHETQYK